MCEKCSSVPPEKAPSLPRRNFLKLAGAAATGMLMARTGFAAGGPPPRPQNVISPDAALARLLAGNERYVAGKAQSHDFVAERPALVGGQNPFAGILSCADSRIGPEYAFDAGRGDLFVCRVAGNFANDDIIASFEYGVAVLGTPLIMVLGHSSCGAVASTIKAVKDGAKFPGHIPSLIRAIRPSVQEALDDPGDLLENSIRQNVINAVARLKSSPPILSKALAEKKLRIVGAVYDLKDGRVDLVA